MTEKEKMLKGGQLYNGMDKELFRERVKCKALCLEYNRLFKYDYPESGDPNFNKQAEDIMRTIMNFEGDFFIEPPFVCDFGYRIKVGKNFYSNSNCMLLDAGGITFGDNVLCAANLQISTLNHSFDKEERVKGYESSSPVVIGNDVWIGGNVVILPGVTIGDNSIIGAGAVVTKSIPENCIAVGNPARVIRKI